MSRVISQRMTVEIEGDFVVFLIGMRINKPWMIHKWWPVFSAMPRMVRELRAHPELGMLGCIFGTKVIVQYWKSFEQLEAYARSKDSEHLPAWKSFNEKVSKTRGDVGIWHETYRVGAGEYECVYSGMPAFGLGTAGELVPAGGRKETARGRLTGDAADPGVESAD